MPFSSHLLEFVKFILIGGIIGIIFDFFRAYRKVKKASNLVVTIQDIIFFIIVILIMILSVIFILDTEIRFYIFAAIFIGIFLYVKIFSKLIISIMSKIIKISRKIGLFIALPIINFFELISKICNILKKYTKKCCKKFLYVILNIHRLLLLRPKKQKRFVNNGKSKIKKKGKEK